MRMHNYSRFEDFKIADMGLDGQVLVVDPRQYVTPYTQFAREQGVAEYGRARLIARRRNGNSTYRFEGVRDCEYFFVEGGRGGLTQVSLEIKDKRGRWREWMLDNPLHWLGTTEYAKRAGMSRRVLVAGLGMGLALWQLAESDAVDEIVVVEREQDVVDLVTPFLPVALKSKNFRIVVDDFYSYCKSRFDSLAESPLDDVVERLVDDETLDEKARVERLLNHVASEAERAVRALALRPFFDAVYWDLAVGTSTQSAPALMEARVLVPLMLGDVSLVRFGMRGDWRT